MRYFLDISYNGTPFHGWQIQPNGNTVQAELERALSTILQIITPVTGSGRTDAGVHAKQQIAHFEMKGGMQPNDLLYKLNSFLPKDISINKIFAVDKEAHARFDATSRLYHYHINRKKDPFQKDTSYYFNFEIDTNLIGKGCEIIANWQNFECFSKVHTEVNNFDCEIFEAKWVCDSQNHLFAVKANRFLRGMVRAMVGTLLDVGLGKTSLQTLQEILESGDRQLAGRAVPAHGLFLQQVTYPEKIYK